MALDIVVKKNTDHFKDYTKMPSYIKLIPAHTPMHELNTLAGHEQYWDHKIGYATMERKSNSLCSSDQSLHLDKSS